MWYILDLYYKVITKRIWIRLTFNLLFIYCIEFSGQRLKNIWYTYPIIKDTLISRLENYSLQ